MYTINNYYFEDRYFSSEQNEWIMVNLGKGNYKKKNERR